MAEVTLALGSAKNLINDSNESLDELDETVRTITRIYETFDALSTSWTGEKASLHKKVIEEAKGPLLGMCKLAQTQTQSLNNVGKIISDYYRK